MASRQRDLADRMAGRRKFDDGYLRETFTCRATRRGPRRAISSPAIPRPPI